MTREALKLPELPAPIDVLQAMWRGEREFMRPIGEYFTADQMRAYASSALAALEGVEPVQVWCDTCEGTGVVHQESQHGVPGSGGDFQCPDCDGRGFNERSYYTTPPAAPAQEPSQPEFFAKLDYDKDFNVLVSVYRRRADATPLLVHQEAWRLQEADKHDGFTGFMWKLASAIAASPSAAAREPLFEVRIAGPDDVHRHSDELAALRHANEVNKQYVNDCLAHPDPMDHVLCVATVHGITKGGEQ